MTTTIAPVNLRQEFELPGWITILATHNQILHQSCHGYMDLENNITMQADAIFRIHSMTKPITCAAVMMLWEQGHFQLDDPIKEWIPAFGKARVFNGENELLTQETDITIRHLLTHTAGLSYGSYDDPVDAQYRELFAELGLPESPTHTESVSLETFCTRLAQIPLSFQPGTAWRYSFSIDVLGRLIEITSSQSLEMFLQERIFDPLGMVDTGFQVPQSSIDRLIPLYLKKDNEFHCIETPQTSRYTQPPRFLEGGGGLVSTTQDYLRFLQMLLNGGCLENSGILAEETVHWMMQNQLAPELLPISFQHTDTLKGCGFGIGFDVLMNPEIAGYPASPGTISWSGAASTGFWLDPARKLIGLVLGQCVPNQEPQLKLMKTFY